MKKIAENVMGLKKGLIPYFFTFTFSLLLCAAHAAQNDVVVTFSTPGPDRYADGTTVVDGECYALVYVPEGKTFAGFLADGNEADPESGKIVLCAPVAKDGRCPVMAFEINAAFAAANYPSGSWKVYLLDTRTWEVKSNGEKGKSAEGGFRLSGTVKGRAKVVNGFGVVGEASVSAGGAPAGTVAAAGGTTGQASGVPEGTPQPKITGIRVVDGFAYITVKDTVPYLAYAAKEVAVGGESKSKVEGEAADGDGSATQGEAGREITIVRPAAGTSGFYKVGRK